MVYLLNKISQGNLIVLEDSELQIVRKSDVIELIKVNAVNMVRK